MTTTNRHDLIDPEPLSTVIVALGAVGSVASIVSLMEKRLEAREREREANRFAIRDSIVGCETALNELRALVRSMEILFASGGTVHGSSRDGMQAVARFGNIQLLFTRDGYDRWREIDEDILKTAGRVQYHMSNLMRHFATVPLKLNADTAARIQRCIDGLNNVLRSLGEVHFQELFRSLEEVIGECGDTMRTLRNELDDLIR